MKAYNLVHPLHGVPAIAVPEGYWMIKGRAVGLVLQFCDGHRTHMTYDEIQAAQAAVKEEVRA